MKKGSKQKKKKIVILIGVTVIIYSLICCFPLIQGKQVSDGANFYIDIRNSAVIRLKVEKNLPYVFSVSGESGVTLKIYMYFFKIAGSRVNDQSHISSSYRAVSFTPIHSGYYYVTITGASAGAYRIRFNQNWGISSGFIYPHFNSGKIVLLILPLVVLSIAIGLVYKWEKNSQNSPNKETKKHELKCRICGVNCPIGKKLCPNCGYPLKK